MSKLCVCNIRAEGDKVLLNLDNKNWLIPWEQALEIARGLHMKAKEAEEYAKINQVIADGALLLRAGVPVGLTDNKKAMDEIGKEAAHNRDLRRYLPGGFKCNVLFGAPVVTGGTHTISPQGVAPSTTFGKVGGK